MNETHMTEDQAREILGSPVVDAVKRRQQAPATGTVWRVFVIGPTVESPRTSEPSNVVIDEDSRVTLP